MAEEIAAKWSSITVGVGNVVLSNGNTMFHGTYQKYSDTIGSMSLHQTDSTKVYVWNISPTGYSIDTVALNSDFVKTSVLPTFQSNVKNYHHNINYIENNEVHFSVRVTISAKLSDYDTVLTIPSGYRGDRTKALIAVKQDSTNPCSYPLYYNSSDGTVSCLYGLPSGNYFIIG